MDQEKSENLSQTGQTGPDKIVWLHTKQGKFSVSETYQFITNNTISEEPHIWNMAWKFRGPQRVRVYIWLVLKERLLTNAERWRRGFAQSDACPMCGNKTETILHLLRDCLWSVAIWEKLIPRKNHGTFFTLNLKDWISVNLSNKLNIPSSDYPWEVLYGITCWNIWKARNAFTFENVFTGTEQVITASRTTSKYVAECGTRYGSITSSRLRLIHWCPPTDPWIKINTDGATATGSRMAGAEEVARDGDGQWLFGFTRTLGHCDALHAELWPILDALSLARSWCFSNVIIESDSLMAIEWITAGSSPGCNNTLVDGILRLRSLIGAVQWQHVPREANCVADHMAKRATNIHFSLTVFHSMPDDVKDLYSRDMANHVVQRRNAS